MSVRYQRGEVARVSIDGLLDTAAAHALGDVSREVMRDWPKRVELDLSAVTTCTTAGVAAVSDCLQLCRRLEDGVCITVASDAGRRALLDSMALV
jgi:ABC-type transporter Mla MlaB component